MKRMKKLIAAASAAVMLASASIVPVSAANSTRYIFVKGDVNNDGAVTMNDYNALYKYYCGFDVPGVDDISADVNKDGQITYKDVKYLYEIFRSGNNTQVMFMENSKNNYTLVYGNETFDISFSPDIDSNGKYHENWHIKDSYRITDYDDMKYICQILKDEHPIHNTDNTYVRSVKSMANEWQIHNVFYFDNEDATDPDDVAIRNRAQSVDIDSDQAWFYPN